MKKYFILLFCFWGLTLGELNARPSKPSPITFLQKDGSRISLFIKGDERMKWAETLDGYSLLRNQDGIYTYAITD
ncbi:MAG: hypothetical protein RR333_08610, partial [Bacteroidales bacterium]